MPAFEDRAVCRAAASEVWKLLYDPARFPEWWAGMERVEAADGTVSRFMTAWPDFAYPTRVEAGGEGRIVISCLLSDIVHEWALEPHPDGCAVTLRIDVPEAESARLTAVAEEARSSLANLVALAEADTGLRFGPT
jgi:uncharacterized protein YndB with AHSA1/START domain